MPVTTCSTKARKVALPKVYHHPVRGGTGCSSACLTQLTNPLRSSSQTRKRRITSASRDRERAREDLHPAVPHPHRIAGERLGWRTRSHRAVAVVDAAVAGAEKELRIGEPAHRAAEVGTVHGERGEALGVVSPEPRGGAGGDPGPGEGRCVVEGDVDRLAHLERGDLAHAAPLAGNLAGERREEEAHHW